MPPITSITRPRRPAVRNFGERPAAQHRDQREHRQQVAQVRLLAEDADKGNRGEREA